MHKKAYTLIEVLISLALMTAVLGMILTAIDIYLRNMVVSRTETEEAQLASAILEKIARDIRSVVVAAQEETLEVDTESLALLFGFSSGVVDDSAFAGAGTDEEEEPEGSGEEEEIIYGAMPGIYGDLDWIQIDTARLPRGEMYGAKQVRSGSSYMPDRLSPSKTIRYYLGEETERSYSGRNSESTEQTDSLGRRYDSRAMQVGLFRRQLDRMVFQYTLDEGTDEEYEEYDNLLAEEVQWIEFAYFDPTQSQQGQVGQWIDYWDMDEMQMLPTAVKITVGIRRMNLGRSFFSFSSSQSDDKDPVIVYSLTVPIPVTVDIPEESDSEEEAP